MIYNILVQIYDLIVNLYQFRFIRLLFCEIKPHTEIFRTFAAELRSNQRS